MNFKEYFIKKLDEDWQDGIDPLFLIFIKDPMGNESIVKVWDNKKKPLSYGGLSFKHLEWMLKDRKYYHKEETVLLWSVGAAKGDLKILYKELRKYFIFMDEGKSAGIKDIIEYEDQPDMWNYNTYKNN